MYNWNGEAEAEEDPGSSSEEENLEELDQIIESDSFDEEASQDDEDESEVEAMEED